MLETHPAAARLKLEPDGRWTIHAPAKINLGLRVFPPRPDGFHDLETWMVPLYWHDTISYQDGPDLSLTLSGRTEGIPPEPDKNLVGRAALRLAERAGIAPRGTLTLHKVLPPGGGLGGGSSDAANVLVLLNRAWELELDAHDLLAIAEALGSDVPFFVHGRSALCRGRGEVMTPLRVCRPLFAVLILPPEGLATGPVFKVFDEGRRHPDRPPTDWCAWAGLDARALNHAIVNDLEPAAFHIAPWLETLRDDAAAAIGQPVHMTGSGSTLFTLTGSAPHAADLSARLGTALGSRATCVPVRILRQR